MNVEIRIDPSKRHGDGLLAIYVRVPHQELDYELDLPFERLHARFGMPDPIMLDFLLLASLCYVIDKVVPRGIASDNWTRELEVAFPVSDVALWNRVANDLGATLGFLSGDVWQILFRDFGEAPIFVAPVRRRRSRPRLMDETRVAASKVCLFSGGLDSLVGAIDLLAGSDKEEILLVGHYDMGGPKSQQRSLVANLPDHYRGRTELLQVRVSHRPDSAPELTLRSRSLVFIALGMFAAKALGNGCPLYAPENGLIAVNIPLTPSRAGSCSTRTMHPFFLEKLGAVLHGLGLENRIINPLSFKTKGECVTLCLDKTLLGSLVSTTVSCSHATRRQNWKRRQAANCGYCVPCLFRRAALHKAGLDEGQDYGLDVLNGELPIEGEGESADDIRAMLDFVRNRKTAEEISREILSIAPVQNLSQHVSVIERGFGEVRSLISDKADTQIRHAAGIVSPRP